ncbi:MAG: class I SAM-dependent methyltransferase [Chloroflexi bacterium]|nr:class I SAM-dependent methyltransferase [Chloroflexota bacterium]
METWKYYDITHKEHILCNPMSLEKIEHLTSLLRLSPEASILEIATGKGEFIMQMAERYGIFGVGVDISPYFIRNAQAKLKERIPQANITFLEMDGADFQPDEPESFDLTACIGASWIFDGHAGTLAALKKMTKPNGWIVVGEPYWLREPDPAYLEAENFQRDTFATHHENVQIGDNMGLRLVYAVASNHDDWDKYEGLITYASEQYAHDNANDPDVPELLARARSATETYLRWGRNTLGWAIYAFRKEQINGNSSISTQ